MEGTRLTRSTDQSLQQTGHDPLDHQLRIGNTGAGDALCWVMVHGSQSHCKSSAAVPLQIEIRQSARRWLLPEQVMLAGQQRAYSQLPGNGHRAGMAHGVLDNSAII